MYIDNLFFRVVFYIIFEETVKRYFIWNKLDNRFILSNFSSEMIPNGIIDTVMILNILWTEFIISYFVIQTIRRHLFLSQQYDIK